MQRNSATVTDSMLDLAVDILERYAAGTRGSANVCRHDSGPMVLAYVANSAGTLPDGLPRRVARRWLDELPERIFAVGAFGGLGGFLAGIRAGIAIDPEFVSLSDHAVDQTRRWLANVRWRSSLVAWDDYDLFRGPSGLLLAGATGHADTTPFLPAAQHLALLCDDPGLERLRAGSEIDPRSAFNVGKINTGMGHGVTGVISALRHLVETFEDGDDYRSALRRACDWLVEEAYLAAHDFITWPPVGRDGAAVSGLAHRRQAWCYGTPGVAWTLWDAGRVLEDDSLQLLGAEAMRSFCRVFDVDYHIDNHDIGEALAVCHGAAGTLAVADAFARHASLSEAASLRDDLDQYLLDRVDQIAAIAQTDMTMLSGAGGILSVMLTAHGGERSWLPQIALR